MTNTAIPTQPHPHCRLCGSHGTTLYQDLHDQLFHTPGNWTLKQCVNPLCGLVWLDPMPAEHAIGQLYETYYTHTQTPITIHPKLLQRVLTSILTPFISLLSKTIGITRNRKRINYFYTLNKTPGTLLDVGCGDGSRLARLQKRGWTVEGQEVDTKAAIEAKNKNLLIHTGDLINLRLQASRYDVIILNHVLEHLPNPENILTECLRLLKPNGEIYCTTPNISSYSHRHFASSWRGLEPPRHLYIYSQSALHRLMENIEINNFTIWTSSARSESFAFGSYKVQSECNNHILATELRAKLLQLKAQYHWWLDKSSGDECILRITKHD